jgi:hypothetical protein
MKKSREEEEGESERPMDLFMQKTATPTLNPTLPTPEPLTKQRATQEKEVLTKQRTNG